MASAGLVVAALFVFGMVALVRSMWPPGHTSDLTKPDRRHHRRRRDLSAAPAGRIARVMKPSTETVELRRSPTPSYVFSGYTGDCAPNGPCRR